LCNNSGMVATAGVRFAGQCVDLIGIYSPHYNLPYSDASSSAAATIAQHCCANCQAVSLRNNLLTGPATQFGDCHLTALDISDNYFTGVLPLPRSRNSTNWHRLQVYRANNNNFSGRLPQFTYGEAPVLAVLVLGNNSLTGTWLQIDNTRGAAVAAAWAQPVCNSDNLLIFTIPLYGVGAHKADGPVCSSPVHGLDPCFVTNPM
jgi:hypothetical protein